MQSTSWETLGWKKLVLMLGKIRAGGEGTTEEEMVGSLTLWTWVWVDSGSWWWTGRPGVLWFMGSQRDMTERLNWTEGPQGLLQLTICPREWAPGSLVSAFLATTHGFSHALSKLGYREPPGNPTLVKTLCFHCQGCWVTSLAQELRPCKPHGAAENFLKWRYTGQLIILTYFW